MKKSMKLFGSGVLVGMAIAIGVMVAYGHYTEELQRIGQLTVAGVILTVVMAVVIMVIHDAQNVCSYCIHPPHQGKKCKVQKDDDRMPCPCTHSQ